MTTLIAWLLNIAYLVVLVALSPAIAWTAWRTGKYREGHAAKLWGAAPKRTGDQFCAWLHAVSVGEVNLLATTLAEIAQRRPEWEVVLSTTTKTGYDLARKKYGPEHTVFYCPLDFSWAVNRAMRRVRPDMLVLAELELWPNLISAAKSSGAKIAIINGRLSENSHRGYTRVRWLVKRVLGQVNVIAAQDEATAKRFEDLGATNVMVTGSLKYDGAETNRANQRTEDIRELTGWAEGEAVWLAGSTQAPEEKICVDILVKLSTQFPQLRLVLVPRHPERFNEVAAMLDASGMSWMRRTQLLAKPQSTKPQPQILLVDTVGELGAWWGVANVGFVGGSFGDRGGQNMIEPAAYGVATCFGPNTKNFRDIVTALLAADGARVVQNEEQLEAFVRRCLADELFSRELGLRAREFVATQLGATQRTIDLLVSLRCADHTAANHAA